MKKVMVKILKLVGCEEPPAVRNGSWTCVDKNDVKTCSLECKPGFLRMGYEKVYCEIHSGWYNRPNYLEFSLCLGIIKWISQNERVVCMITIKFNPIADTHSYLERMIRSLSQDLQKSSGYHLLLSHKNDRVQHFSLEFAKIMLNIFP